MMVHPLRHINVLSISHGTWTVMVKTGNFDLVMPASHENHGRAQVLLLGEQPVCPL